MTRKDYILIASVVRQFADRIDRFTSDRIITDPLQFSEELAHLFADKLVGTNPHFDRQRFVSACTSDRPSL